MSYIVIVEFQRDYHDDASVINSQNPSAKELAVQLAKELQQGYDECGIAGSFQVKTIVLNGIQYLIE